MRSIEYIEAEKEWILTRNIDLEAEKTKYIAKVKARKKNTHLTPKKKKRK